MVKKAWEGLKTFTVKCKRVWLTLKKPSREEFEQVAKVSGIGIGIIGIIGFIIAIFMGFLF